MKLDKKMLANTSWLMIGRAVQLGLTFIIGMVVTRYLGPTEFGKMNYVYSYIQLFLPLCTLGLNDIAAKELVDNKQDQNKIVGTMAILRVFTSIVFMFCATQIVYMLKGSSVYREIAFLQSFSLLFQSFDCIAYFYQANLLTKKNGIIYALSYILTTIFRIIAIVLKKDIFWFAFAMSLDFAMIALLFIFTYLKDGNKFEFSFDAAKQLLKKSYYYIISGVLIVVYGKVTDTLLLGNMVNDTSVGYYTAATNLINAWPFILTAIIDSTAPLIIEEFKIDKDKFKTKIKRLYATIFYIGICAAICITLLSDFIVLLLYGKAYMPTSMPLKIASWSTTFAYIGVARSIWLQCNDKIKYETYITLFGAITNIILNYVLIQRFEIIGAAIALTLTQLLTNFVYLFFMKETRENAKLIMEAILLKGVFDKEESSNV